MSDELPVEDGAVDNPNPVDYEKRWKDTHANWNTLNEQMTRFKQDPNAIIEFIQETHPDLLAETDEEEDTLPAFEEDEDDPVAPIRSEMEQFKAWQQQVENERGAERFARDLKAELGDETLPGKVTDWIKDRTAALGNNPKALKQAVEEYRAFADELRPPSRKSAPAAPQPGRAGEPKHDPRDREARRARMAAAIEAARQE